VFELFLILVICKNIIVGCVSKNYNKNEGYACVSFAFYYLFILC
jgi:phosphoribosylaminoimidazole-succinocarboxamide synthase